MDSRDNVYVCGGGVDYVTVKYYPNGDTAWVRRYNGPGNSSDEAYAIALDSSGNVYVTGDSYGSGTFRDYATVKYYPNGDTAWVTRYNGPGNRNDLAKAMALDNSGNVYVTGWSEGSGTGLDYLDYATIKYAQGFYPIEEVKIDSVVQFRDQNTLQFPPSQLNDVQVGDRLRIKGRVVDSLGQGVGGVVVRCFDPITGDLFSGDSAVYRVTTDAQGYFIYPDTITQPQGIVCDTDNLFALWFNAGNKAVR